MDPNALVAATPVKRRKRSAAERLKIVEETRALGASVARVARSYGINANQVFAWRKLAWLASWFAAKPAAEMPASRLLPVTVSETATPLIAEAADAPAAIPCSATIGIVDSHSASEGTGSSGRRRRSPGAPHGAGVPAAMIAFPANTRTDRRRQSPTCVAASPD